MPRKDSAMLAKLSWGKDPENRMKNVKGYPTNWADVVRDRLAEF